MASKLRFQFRLWQLGVAITLLGVVLAGITSLRNKAARQRRAMHVVQMHQGSYDALATSAWKEWLAGGAVDRTLSIRFQRLGQDDVWGPYGPRGEGVLLHRWHPRRFPELRQALAELPGVTELSFAGSPLRGHVDDLLPESTQLTYLSLEQTKVRDDDLVVLRRVLNLTRLSLRRTSTTDAGLRHVSPLRQLELLDLSSTDVSDRGMAEIARLKSLTMLRLENTNLTDEGLRELDLLTGLEELDLGMTRVSEKSLPQLKAMQVRRRLIVPAEWRWEAVAELERSSPKSCEVSASPYWLKDRPDAKAK